MNKLIVTYDLCGVNKNYDELINRIKQFPDCVKINKSTWVIKTTYDSENARDELKKYIDLDDYLFVAKLTGESAWNKTESLSSKVKKLLESN